MNPISEFAAAKLNLYLHVLGKDSRGYHLLDSLVTFANIGDELFFRPADELSVIVDGLFRKTLGPMEENLVWRAAVVMGEVFRRAPHFAITLTKNLPPASGVGGGSADAAACIRALCRLWEIDPQDRRIMAIALALGADVPVCLASRAAYMGGIGDILTPLEEPLPNISIVLANPAVLCPTKKVFSLRKGPFSQVGRFPCPPANAEQMIKFLKDTRNDLTQPALVVAPSIGVTLAALRDHGALLARMLGSGATCYGIFNTARAARTAVNEISDLHPKWWVEYGELL